PVLQLLAVRTPLLFPQLIGALSNDVLRNRHDVSFPGEMRKMNAASGTVFHRGRERQHGTTSITEGPRTEALALPAGRACPIPRRCASGRFLSRRKGEGVAFRPR